MSLAANMWDQNKKLCIWKIYHQTKHENWFFFSEVNETKIDKIFLGWIWDKAEESNITENSKSLEMETNTKLTMEQKPTTEKNVISLKKKYWYKLYQLSKSIIFKTPTKSSTSKEQHKKQLSNFLDKHHIWFVNVVLRKECIYALNTYDISYFMYSSILMAASTIEISKSK